MATTNYTIRVIFNDAGHVDLIFDTGSYHQDKTRVLNAIIESSTNGFVFFKNKDNEPLAVNLKFIATMYVKDKDDD